MLEQKHRCELVLDNGLTLPTFKIPIKYIKQAEGEARPRALNEQHAESLAEMMWWNRNAGAGSPALVCVRPVDGDETTTDREKFQYGKIPTGHYEYICFGHQHVLHGKEKCVERDAKEHPNPEDQCDVFKLLESRVYIGLSNQEMVLVRTNFPHPSVWGISLVFAQVLIADVFLYAQLGNEQNNIDSYLLGRGQTEIMLSFRNGIELVMRSKQNRPEDAPDFPEYPEVPHKKEIFVNIEDWLKKHVFFLSSVDYTSQTRSTYSVVWNCAMLQHRLYELLKPGITLSHFMYTYFTYVFDLAYVFDSFVPVSHLRSS